MCVGESCSWVCAAEETGDFVMPLLGIFWMGSGHVYFGSFWFISLDELNILK